MYHGNAARSWVICLILKKTSNEERSWRFIRVHSKRFGVNVVPPFFVCKAEFLQILGILKSKKKSDNPEIVKLSEKQLNVEIN